MTVHSDMKNQTLVDEIPDGTLMALIDKSKFEQVIINLISNAIKYTNENGQIKIKTYHNENTIKISISDNGIGIPKKDIPFIFDRFYRVDKGRSRSLGGTGLGLSICNAIISTHGGSINVKSTYGQGSEFIVSLPAL